MSNIHEKELQADLKSGVEKLMRENNNLNYTEALSQVTKDMLKNNPFVPPTSGCPINDLPNELLAHIFYVGMEMEEEGPSEDELEEEDDEYEDELDLLDWDSDDEGEENHTPASKRKDIGKGKADRGEEQEKEEEEEEDAGLPFQVLVSHVCRHFREVAIGEHYTIISHAESQM